MSGLGLTDKPVGSLNEESLGVNDYVIALSEFIESCETPMTIAIQADWGAGKTSMMNLVKENLSNSPKSINTMWFNTWQFSQFDMGDDLPISLLSQFVKRLGGEDSKEIVKKLAGLTKKAGGMLAKVALGGAAGNLIDGGGKVIDAIFEENLDASEQIVKLKDQLETIVLNKIQKEGHDRVVVFIDDLDRLVPEKAVELLEIMKLFLDIPRCVFVLAVDYNVVITGLEKKFGVGIDDMKGKSFFDKIIQLPFNLPVAQYDVSKYFKELLQGKFEYNDSDIDTFVKLANNSVGFNPRSMKRLFNSLQLLKMVAKSKNILDSDGIAKAEEKQRILFAILCLQTAYESMYRFMIKHKHKIDQEFFDTFSDIQMLKESEYYDEVRKELHVKEGEDDKVVRFLEFFTTFYDAIQLESDESEDANENLSDKELENLMRFLSFSSITTNNSQGIDASSGTFQFKSYMNPFIKEKLRPHYQNQLEKLGIEKFETWANNNEGSLYITVKRAAIYINVVVWTNFKNVHFGLDDLTGDIGMKHRTKEWFESHLKEIYPDMLFNGRRKYGFMELKKTSLDESIGFDERLRFIEDFSMENFGIFLSNMVQYFEETHETYSKIQNLLTKIENELKETFAVSEGWSVDMSQSRDLRHYQPIKIRHKEWGDGEYAIYLSSLNTYFNKPYIGVLMHQNFKSANSIAKEALYAELKNQFMAVDSTAQSFFRSFPSIDAPIKGDMYKKGKIGSYVYSEDEENVVVQTLVGELKKVAAFKDRFSSLVK